MDQAIIIYLLLAFIVIAPIIGVLLRRRARAAGTQRAENKKGRQAAGGGLGETLTLATDRVTAESIVGAIFAAWKRVRRLEDGSWAQTHYNDDDVVYGLVDTGEGTLVAVQRAIEFSGTLNGMKAWQRFRSEISAEASNRGIAVNEGVRPLSPTGGSSATGAQVWIPA